jgi:predicted component of type VI protein secretion system
MGRPAPGVQMDKTVVIQKMLTMLSETQEKELTCDEVFAALDQFAELAARGEDVSKLMPLIQHHLNMCGDCMEEYQTLHKIVMNPA